MDWLVASVAFALFLLGGGLGVFVGRWDERERTRRRFEDAWRTAARPGQQEEHIRSKAAYVRRQGQSRNHTCHWPGCQRQVPPAMWGCKPHWFKLPKHLRDRIWDTYEIGQERSMTPSDDYLDAALAVQVWIDEHAPPAPPSSPSTPTAPEPKAPATTPEGSG